MFSIVMYVNVPNQMGLHIGKFFNRPAHIFLPPAIFPQNHDFQSNMPIFLPPLPLKPQRSCIRLKFYVEEPYVMDC